MSLNLAAILERNIALSDVLLSEVARRVGDENERQNLGVKALQELTGIFSKVQRTQNTAINARRALAKDMKAFFDSVSDAQKLEVIVEFYALMSREQRMVLLAQLERVGK